MVPMNRGRTPDTYSEAMLLASLTLPERYAYGEYLTTGRLAAWLGKPQATLIRWRARNHFPAPAGRAPAQPGRYKVRHGWDYRHVLAWLRHSGRLGNGASVRALQRARKAQENKLLQGVDRP